MSVSSLQRYLFFNGRCEEAIEFYRSALGAEVGMVTDQFGLGWMIGVEPAES